MYMYNTNVSKRYHWQELNYFVKIHIHVPQHLSHHLFLGRNHHGKRDQKQIKYHLTLIYTLLSKGVSAAVI